MVALNADSVKQKVFAYQRHSIFSNQRMYYSNQDYRIFGVAEDSCCRNGCRYGLPVKFIPTEDVYQWAGIR